MSEVGISISSNLLPTSKKDEVSWGLAQKLESKFVSEMLKSSGLGESRSGFGGGIGEDQFSSFLTDEYAKATVAAGGVGLAESIYESIITRKDLT